MILRKVIVIDEESGYSNKKNILDNKYVSWLIYMLGYAVVLMVVDWLFDSFYISSIWYAFVGAVIIYILNRNVKPFLVIITLPITLVSLGLFYPVVNVFVLYITSFILGSNFVINGFLIDFIIAIMISIFYMIMESFLRVFIDKGRRMRNG